MFPDEETCELDGVCSVCGERTSHAGPTFDQFRETLYEMLDELNWGAIDWYGEYKPDFLRLLQDAWERAKTQRV